MPSDNDMPGGSLSFWINKEGADYLLEVVTSGEHQERLRAIELIGRLGHRLAVPELRSMLEACTQALISNTAIQLPGSEQLVFPVAATLCEALARLDTRESHWVLVTVAENLLAPEYLRQAAVDVMSHENDWFDLQFLKKCLTQREDKALLIGALFAVCEMAGPRRKKFIPLVVGLLNHTDPEVVMVAVDVLRLGVRKTARLRKLLIDLEGDRRYCAKFQSTVGDYLTDLL